MKKYKKPIKIEINKENNYYVITIGENIFITYNSKEIEKYKNKLIIGEVTRYIDSFTDYGNDKCIGIISNLIKEKGNGYNTYYVINKD